MIDYPNTSCSIRAIDAEKHTSFSILGKIKSIFLGLIKWWSVPTLFINMAASIALCHLVNNPAVHVMLWPNWIFGAIVTTKFWDAMGPKSEQSVLCIIFTIGSWLVVAFFPLIALALTIVLKLRASL